MRTFTAFRGISPAGSRHRHIDDPFGEMRRRVYGEQTMDRDDRELTIPSANVSEQDREGTSGYLIEMAAPATSATISTSTCTMKISSTIKADIRSRPDAGP